jgi:predicted metal-dependent HD superfamily phosphohydrolase
VTQADIIDGLKALAPAPLPAATWETIASAYRTPPRSYHTLEHVLEVARTWSQQIWRLPLETFLAVLFHDAVYIVGRDDNELKSAELSGDSPRVRELILLTARHGKLRPQDVDDEAARFLDCDMAILGSDPERFDRYEQQIAQEYRPVVGEAAYASGRRRFLAGLLQSDRIFLSDAFHARLDASARSNLRRALNSTAP